MLATLPEPPDEAEGRLALAELQALGGLSTDGEALIDLGKLMVELPVGTPPSGGRTGPA